MKSFLIKIKNLLFFILLLTLIKSCGYDKSSNNRVNVLKKDSTLVLINKSKNSKIYLKKRKSYLYLAHKLNDLQKNDSIRNRMLLKIAFQAYKLNDSSFFKRTNNEAYNSSKQLKDTFGIADTHWNNGLYYSRKEDLDSAYHHYFQAHKNYNFILNKYYSGKMLYNMATVQKNIKDYINSEAKAIQAISLFKHLSKKESIYRCYNLLGVIHKELKDYQKSIFYHNKSLEYLNKINDNKTFKESSFNDLGLTYQKKGDYINGINYFNKALLNDSLSFKNIKLYAKILDNLAYTRLLNGDTINVKEELLHSLKIRDSLDFVSGILINKLHLAEYHLKTTDTATAYRYAKNAHKLAISVTNNRDILASLQLLSEIDPKNSKQYFDEHRTLSNALEQKERKLRNKFARIRFETDEKIEEVNELSLQRSLIITTSIALITILLLLYFIRHQRGKHRELQLKTEQQEANEEIYKLMLKQQTKLEEGRVKERHRISEELHDGILGKIFYTRLGLDFLGSEVSEKAITKHKGHVHELHEIEKEIRAISHELKYELLAPEANYIQLIDYLASTQSTVGAFEYHIEQNDDMYWSSISDVVKINLYRIVQEGLQNINKHAKASIVTITFSLKDATLGLIIQDNGIGFDRTEKANGIGLENISSRVNKLKGTFAIESNPNKGTHLTVLIPITLNEVLDDTNT